MSEFKVGDRVKVTFEAEVYDGNDAGFGVSLPNELGYWVNLPNDASRTGISIEKIEPPVEIFGPGDVVREKRTDLLFAIATTGYVPLSGTGRFQQSGVDFTSEHYEKVSLD